MPERYFMQGGFSETTEMLTVHNLQFNVQFYCMLLPYELQFHCAVTLLYDLKFMQYICGSIMYSTA